ncbi:MAG: D-alanyl-D-alanine carboxypeptidase/D-alanyl-D-alanine endopeptidase [Planctomycetota bacterium]|jgi:D-alanyl-D-alanine carboxypeptidase/D-alanyl-D-alanine-endopeptidase (penicillin-binding protein 4)
MLGGTLTLLLVVLGAVEANLQEALGDSLRRSGINRSGLGVVVGRAGGPVLLSVNADTPRIPASNQKVLTAAAALRRLGRDFSFRTTFAKAPDGSLVVVGDGDPNMSGRFFDGDPNAVLRALARDLKKDGLTAAPGGIVLDAGRFDDEFVHPDWPVEQRDRWYAAPVAALLYNDSCWDITVRPGARAGAAVTVEVEPSLLRPRIDVACSTVARGARHGVHLLHAEDGGLRIQGGVVAGSSGEGGHLTVKDPVLFFGRALRAALDAAGIKVEGAVRRGSVAKREELLVYKSSLRRTLGVMLGRSQNLYAECIYKRTGGGTFEGGAAAVRAVLAEMKIPVGGLVVRDGSGLSRGNRVAPVTLYRVLDGLRDEPAFVESLASGGEGTLRRRYRDLGKRIRAKTGTIRGVSSLCGYVEGARGNRYVFVVLANGRSVAHARRFQDLVVQTLARAP